MTSRRWRVRHDRVLLQEQHVTSHTQKQQQEGLTTEQQPSVLFLTLQFPNDRLIF